MLAEVKHALLQERLRQMEEGFNDCVIDGYSGFIFSTRYGDVLNPQCVNRAIERICRDYNAEEKQKAKMEKLLKKLACKS